MLQRTVSLLRRLVTWQPESSSPLHLTGEEDRRMRARYPANVEVPCRPAGAAGAETLQARVRNISLGGINVIVNRHFKPGDLLSLELPAAEGQAPNEVLACVVHVTPRSAGEWSLGCNFSRELTDEDLRAFGARRQRPATDDQRNWERFPCSVKALCQSVMAGDQPQCEAKVLNISANGIGLLVGRATTTGTLLNLELLGPHGGQASRVLACVVHAAPRDNQWALGCNFIRELTEQELKALV
jgi:c-di-GMP-binding flagellar brake protein YcgR